MSDAVNWTDGQKRAIEHRGSDVLVSASAGTGKTAVLSSRCLALLSESRGRTGILNMLILTFTEAAAQEMSLRIRCQLMIQAQADPRYRHLQREMLMLPSADISTIHAFCKRLITDHFHLLDLDPGFRLIDSDEQRLLKTEALEETLEWAWQEPSLADVLPELFHQRHLHGPAGFGRRIVAVHDFLEGQVSPARWREQALLLARDADAPGGAYAEAQWRAIQERLTVSLGQLERAQSLFQIHGGTGTSPATEMLAWIEAFQGQLGRQAYDACFQSLRAFKKPRVTKAKGCDEAQGEQIRTLIKYAVDEVSGLHDWAVLCPNYQDRLAVPVRKQTETLLSLASRFSTQYGRRKRRANGLDFADLEHLALKLLVEPDPLDASALRGTEVAQTLRQQYHHVFVDEYQDVNAVQEALISALTRGDNLFAVGDVKQSIYAFRGAQPHLFQKRLAQADTDPPTPAGRALRVDLNVNFRSRPGILDCVNHLFTRLMTVASAGMSYDVGARFVPPVATAVSDDANTDERPLELHLLEELPAGKGEREDNIAGRLSTREHQAVLVARRIRRLMGLEAGESPYRIFDKDLGCHRDLQFGDIAVLMRSPAKRVDDYLKILRMAEIPVSCPGASGYFEATEIGEILSLLKVLDNPRRDIEFVSVLRGSLGAVTDTELAKIVLLTEGDARQRPFSQQVTRYCEQGEDRVLVKKLNLLLQQLEHWRRQAREGALADLVWSILSGGGLLAMMQTLPGSELRRANLLKFHDRAIQFSGFASGRGGPSLRRFVEFIEQLQDAGADWTSAEQPALERDAVQITSVHKSKGLEFPVVILAELNSPFSRQDFTDDVLLSSHLGLGLQVVDGRSGLRLPSMAHQVIAEERRAVAMAEEMRVLYVALTRAQDRLILTGACKARDVHEWLRLLDVTALTVDAYRLRSSQSLLDWLIAGFSDQRAIWEALGLEPSAQAVKGGLIDVHYHSRPDVVPLDRWMKRGASTPEPSPNEEGRQGPEHLLAAAQDRLTWVYPYDACTRVAAKRSVSQLVHSDAAEHFTEPSRLSDFRIEQDPSRQRSQRAVGTATHWLLSQLSLDQTITRASLTRLLHVEIEAGCLTAETAEAIDVQSILDFFDTPLGKMVRDPANRVLREWPFTIRVEVDQDDADTTREGQVVQGIADMVVLAEQGAHIIDFKTDRVTSKQLEERTSVYREQLLLYARAVERCLGCSVEGLWLYFLSVGEALEIIPRPVT